MSEDNKLNKIFWLILLFIVGAAGVLFILPTFWLRLMFGLLFGFVLIWTLRSGRHLEVSAIALVAAYALSVFQFGSQFLFHLPAWLIALTTFIWVTVLFWIGFRLKIGSITTSAKLLSLVVGLVGAQIALALVFWPTHFLVSATTFFAIFYFAWMMSNFYMAGILNRHRIIIHGGFVCLLLIVELWAAQWTI